MTCPEKSMRYSYQKVGKHFHMCPSDFFMRSLTVLFQSCAKNEFDRFMLVLFGFKDISYTKELDIKMNVIAI